MTAVPRDGGAPCAVLCDFDGTIALDDVTDSLLLRFARPGWVELERDWQAGRIGSRQCMAGQIALLDCSLDELKAHLETIPVDPQFAAFAAAMAAEGVPLRIVSDGLDLVIEALLARHGLAGTPVAASRLVRDGPRAWRLEFPHAQPTCASATCKCALARPPHVPPRSETVLVGDGASDFCAAAQVDFVIAKHSLLARCRGHRLRHAAFDDFAGALAAWHSWRRRSAPATFLPTFTEAHDARG